MAFLHFLVNKSVCHCPFEINECINSFGYSNSHGNLKDFVYGPNTFHGKCGQDSNFVIQWFGMACKTVFFLLFIKMVCGDFF